MKKKLSKFTDDSLKKTKRVIEMIAEGMETKDACSIVGISRHTFYKAKRSFKK